MSDEKHQCLYPPAVIQLPSSVIQINMALIETIQREMVMPWQQGLLAQFEQKQNEYQALQIEHQTLLRQFNELRRRYNEVLMTCRKVASTGELPLS